MRNECNIIRDLLPLYIERMVSADTAEFVEEHLRDCELCRKEYENSKVPQSTQEIAGAMPLQKLNRKMKIKRLQTIALTAVFVIALFVSAFAVLDAPIYFPYSKGIVTPEKLGDKGMLLTFDKKVTDFDYTVYDDPDGENFYYCDIKAWTSLWDIWFSQGKDNLSVTVTTRQVKPILAVYVPNDGSETVCIGKYDPNAEDPIERNVHFESTVLLPRLSLGYCLMFAIIALAALGIVWFVTRKKTELRVWVERIWLYPVAYIIGHCIVSGINWTTYSLPRDLSLIIFISILLYSGLLLAHNIWHLKREIMQINH